MAIAINGSGTVTGISVGGLPDGIVDTDMLAAKAATAAKLGNGAILQVIQLVKTDTQSITNSGYPSTNTSIASLEPAITPSSSSNKILLSWSVNVSGGTNSHVGNILTRTISGSETTLSLLGDTSSDRSRSAQAYFGSSDTTAIYTHNICAGSYLDSPSTTSAITYKIRFRTNDTTIYINRSLNNNDANWSNVTASTFTLMEVAA